MVNSKVFDLDFFPTKFVNDYVENIPIDEIKKNPQPWEKDFQISRKISNKPQLTIDHPKTIYPFPDKITNITSIKGSRHSKVADIDSPCLLSKDSKPSFTLQSSKEPITVCNSNDDNHVDLPINVPHMAINEIKPQLCKRIPHSY